MVIPSTASAKEEVGGSSTPARVAGASSSAALPQEDTGDAVHHHLFAFRWLVLSFLPMYFSAAVAVVGYRREGGGRWRASSGSASDEASGLLSMNAESATHEAGSSRCGSWADDVSRRVLACWILLIDTPSSSRYDYAIFCVDISPAGTVFQSHNSFVYKKIIL